MVSMVASMTAFGRIDGDLVEWEIKSVNHRYLELGFRLPEPLRGLEPTLRAMTATRVRRGKIDAVLRLREAAAPPRVCDEALRGLLAAIATVRRQAPDATVSAMQVLGWPGILAADETLLARCREAAVTGYRAALEALLAERRREGAQIGGVMARLLDDVAALGRRVRTLVAEQSSLVRERLHTKARDLPVRVDAARLEQEVALLAQRGDVTEELERLDMHVAAARAALAGEGPCGRRLDFLLQELGREANTLAAKAPLPAAASLAVDLKVAVERLREQVQNVE